MAGGGGDDSVFTFTMTLIMMTILLSSISSSYGYDSLDPYGNITITWDFIAQSGADTYDIKVSVYNLQQYRHIEQPGWKLSWFWNKTEVIWDMRGAEAVEQGDCSLFKSSGSGNLPHCCLRRPVILDLLPGTPYNMQYQNCCKGGVLSSMNQDPSKYLSSFGMSIGNFISDPAGISRSSPFDRLNLTMPSAFSLGVPGYTCGEAYLVPPTRYYDEKGQGRRWKQTLETWNVTCTYSQFQAFRAPKCCVSLSAFYNTTIVGCPRCSCGCQTQDGAKCIESGENPPPSMLKLPKEQQASITPPLVTCSPHMCPIRVHWHVKQSYREYWRVKITIINMNFLKNYTDWNLVAQHPNLQSIRQLFSFNYHPLNTYGNINDTGMFWGIQYYNDMILSSGNAQTEMLLHKDDGVFTFREGWAFPRRISFNGDECVMPPPDEYPTLPNSAATLNPYLLLLSFLFLGVATPALLR